MLRKIEGDGVTLAVQDEGEGPPVLLIHGFPDSHRLWRHQVPALVEAGKRVIAPDMRGFGESDRPEEVGAYGVRHSVGDMLAVLDALEVERAQVIGHDWGAAVAWALAAFVPERVERLVVLSVGHPGTLSEPSIEQREKSWYMLFFQFADVAETVLQRDDWRLMREWLRDNGDVEDCIAGLSRPGALTAALNWYRANVPPAAQLREGGSSFPTVTVPTLGIWSSGDDYLTEAPMAGSGEHVDAEWRYERIEGASHWMQVDEPDRLNELLLDFLALRAG